MKSYADDRLDEIERMREGWDGGNAAPIDGEIIDAARRRLRDMDLGDNVLIYPTDDEGLCIIWCADDELEAELRLSPGEMVLDVDEDDRRFSSHPNLDIASDASWHLVADKVRELLRGGLNG